MRSTDISTGSYSIRQLIMMAEKEKLLFDYPIQRPGGQWKRQQESYLIHSLAADYPIPPIYLLSSMTIREIKKNNGPVNESVTVMNVLDGKQRITTAMRFRHGLFSLDKTTPNVFINDEEFELAGKKFEALDPEVQEMVLSRTLITYTINSENVTDEEIEDLFFRMNNGTGLSVAHKTKPLMGTEWAKRIVNIGNHDLFNRNIAAFSPAQLKAEGHLIAILQTMMMMDDYAYKNVSQRVISEYGETFKEDTERKIELLDNVEKALDYLDQTFSSKQGFLLKKVNFPMTVLTAIDAIEMGIKHEMFAEWAYEFAEACKSKQSVGFFPTSYMNYSGIGSTDLPKALGRLKEMKRHFNEYLKYNKVTV
jgi:hypothetical protein